MATPLENVTKVLQTALAPKQAKALASKVLAAAKAGAKKTAKKPAAKKTPAKKGKLKAKSAGGKRKTKRAPVSEATRQRQVLVRQVHHARKRIAAGKPKDGDAALVERFEAAEAATLAAGATASPIAASTETIITPNGAAALPPVEPAFPPATGATA